MGRRERKQKRPEEMSVDTKFHNFIFFSGVKKALTISFLKEIPFHLLFFPSSLPTHPLPLCASPLPRFPDLPLSPVPLLPVFRFPLFYPLLVCKGGWYGRMDELKHLCEPIKQANHGIDTCPF